MKFAWIVVLALLVNDPIKISKINSAKTAAKNAFQSGDYQTAVAKYKYLVDSLGVKEDEVLLNLAHAQYLLKDTASAFSGYQSLIQSAKNQLASKANLQLGLITHQKGKAEEALSYFKQALKQDPANEEARFNYEMLKKKLDEQKKKDQKQNKDQQNKEQEKKQQQNKDQEKKDQEEKDQEEKDQEDKKDQEEKKENEQKDKDQQQKEQEQKEKEQKEKEQKEREQKDEQEKEKQEQEKKDMKNLDKEKLELMKISEEKARMILEAMKNQEKQYLQQNKRKATKSKDRNKPDW